MAFTARRALSAIKLLVLAAAGLASCGNVRQDTSLKAINVDSLELRTENGLMYSGTKAFSGRVYALTSAGDTIFSKSYRDGAEDGQQKLWFSNKQLQEKRWYKDGKKDGVSYGYWPNGSRRYKYHLAKDVYEGVQYEWYPNGRLFSKKIYKSGQESGLQQTWEENGKIKSNYEARNGRNYGNIGKKNCYSVFRDAAFHSTP
ncbi:MAG: variant repeat-containing protein [Sphingobacteriaceae bacterium]|jgi:antitoxin component YwqK of YwqJK toxin-antitoxin module|nr:variant repeat-containing protein [Sphingobacteriaceae bacterium]